MPAIAALSGYRLNLRAAANMTTSSMRRCERATVAELIVISAGFDAHKLDPLSSLNLSEADFRWATHRIMEIADVRSAGRVISVLEGGYALESLARSVATHVTALMQS